MFLPERPSSTDVRQKKTLIQFMYIECKNLYGRQFTFNDVLKRTYLYDFFFNLSPLHLLALLVLCIKYKLLFEPAIEPLLFLPK